MGRQSANEGFLKAWFRYSGQQDFFCLARYREEAEIFARAGQSVHVHAGQQGIQFRWVPQAQIHRVAGVGTAFLPGPQVADCAWMRRRDPQAQAHAFSLVGMTHTSCELAIQDALANMLLAPVYAWDAQICPSVSVQKMVARLLDDEAAWLGEHMGATCRHLPQLPVLPLGVHCSEYALPAEQHEALRREWRQRWALAAHDVCVLYVGRLDLQSKANLFPMFDALELAAQALKAAGGPALTLVLAGWFASEWNEKILREGVVQACPSLRVVFEDGRLPEVRHAVWQAADIFSSLVDNIQETFGLTPIEAMAAGLPVVVTEYDGYRESVRHGQDGFLVPTWQPEPGAGVDLMDRHADVMDSYNHYVGRASWLVGVDIRSAAEAYVRLAQDPQLRQRMGASGAAHARSVYDWSNLVPRYQQLFADLAASRPKAGKSTVAWQAGGAPGWGARHPRRSDPFHSFSHYPSALLQDDLHLQPGPLLPSVNDPALQAGVLKMQLGRPVYQGGAGLLQEDFLLAVLQRLSAQRDAVSVKDLLAQLVPQSGDAAVPPQKLQRQLGWLIKTGLVSPVHDNSARSEVSSSFDEGRHRV
jgi:glycosyltransferase involved in cell wall biosynthesis